MASFAGELPERATAAVLTAPQTLELREFPVSPPEPGWAVIRVERAGICGTDLRTFSGELLQYAGTPHERRLSYPLIPGHENVGTVAAVAGDVPDHEGRPVRPGDRVVVGANVVCGRCHHCRAGSPYYACERLEDYGNSLNAARPPHLLGGWSEYLSVMPGSRLFRAPQELSDAAAALVEPYSVTHGLDRASRWRDGGLTGTTTVVLGCGPLGLCHVVKALVLGAGRVIAVDRHPIRLEMAERLGAEQVLSLDATTREDRLEAVREATLGRGADVVVDASGDPDAFAEGLAALGFGGTLVEPGAFTGTRRTTIDVSADVCLKDARVIGVGGEDDAAYPGSISQLSDGGPAARLTEMVTHVLPLERVREGIDAVLAGAAVKVQLAMGAGPQSTGAPHARPNRPVAPRGS